MNKSIFILFSILLISSCGIQKLSKNNVYKEVHAEEFQTYTEDTNNILIDVRTNSEYQKSHIKGAINVSYFGGHFKEKVEVMHLDTSKTVLIYCETQHRSLFVAKKLHKIGFQTIIDLDKGMIKWRKYGFPSIEQKQ